MIRDDAWISAFPHFFPEMDSSLPRIVIEDDVYVGFSSFISAIRGVRICEGTLISDGFYASDHTHGFDPREGSPRHQPLSSKGPVEIGKNCFIGFRVSVLPGVTLGQGCVVGAHSVVTRSFPEFSMLAGVPARRIKSFNFSRGSWGDCE
jgi:lipopolysaccharide O-acetyltransferase